MDFGLYLNVPVSGFLGHIAMVAPNVFVMLSDAINLRNNFHHLYFNDNTPDGVRSLLQITASSTKCVQLDPLDENLSNDEFMIPYYGRHYAKLYIKWKPIRFSNRNWALWSSTGYMYAFNDCWKFNQDTCTEVM